MNKDNVISYKGRIIKCPLCGNATGFGIIDDPYLVPGDVPKLYLKCYECNLEFEGAAVGEYQKNHEPQVIEYQDKNVWTVYFLDRKNHIVQKCFKTKTSEVGIEYILEQLNSACDAPKKYVAWIEVD